MKSTVNTYPAPAGATKSPVYTVTAGGKAVPVEHFCDVHHTHFAFAGECEVVVSVKPTIGHHRNLKYVHHYTIQPARREVQSSSEMSEIRFTLTEPAKLVIQVNEYERLFLFADLIDVNAPVPGAPGVVDASKFLKDNTGQVVQTSQLQQAIAATPKNGTLFVPPGVYRTGTFTLKSDMTLYLAGGAVIKGSPNPADYPPDDETPYWSKLAFVRISNANNVTIRGHGVIDANGAVVRTAQCVAHLFIARDSQNVVMEDIHVRDSAAWCLHTINCEHVILRNVKMINDWDVMNTDGIDPVSCRHMLVEDCFVHSSDDGVVIKSFNGIPCDDIMVRRNVVIDKKSALKIGTETEGNISNVTFIDNDVIVCDRGMALYIEDDAEVTNTKFISNHFEGFYPDLRRKLIDFYTWDRKGDQKGGGKIRGVLVKDCVAAVKWPYASCILNGWGVIEDVRFENFVLEGKVCRNLREADVVVDVMPHNDSRRPGVKKVTFSPNTLGKKAWNPALVDGLRGK